MSNLTQSSTIPTPVGPLTILASPDGAVRAAGFATDEDALTALVHPSLRGPVQPQQELGPINRAVRAYFDGDLAAIDAIPVEQRTSGDFLAHAWQVLRSIKPGQPLTYTAFAELAGRPLAVRGAASACARNAAALFVPCHRVLRLDGSLGGYRWGLPVKKWLLAHEQR